MSDVWWSAVLIGGFAVVGLFFSANGIALRIYSRVRLYEAFKAVGKEPLAEELVRQAEKLVLSCGLYRLLANICLILSLLALLAAQRQGGLIFIDFVVTFIISLGVFSLFSLAIPHAWAKYAGEKLLARTYRVLVALAAGAWPALFLFRLYDGLIRRLAGVGESGTDQQQEEKDKEFLDVVEERRIEGVVDEEEQKMIEGVLELSDTCVEKVMTPRTDIVAVGVDTDLAELLKIISKAGYSRIPVYDGDIDNIVGLIYAKDLLIEIGRQEGAFKVREKIRPAYFVPETKPLRQLLHEFQKQKLHIAIVLDEYGGTAGIVTIEDILEELVGEIADEYEGPEPEPIRRLDDRTVEVDARLCIDDLNRQLQLQLPEEQDYDTIGGFVFSHLGRIPRAGESFNYDNLTFTISAAEAQRIKRIKIQKMPV